MMNYHEECDYSSLSLYIDCPRKFLFRYVLGLRPSGPPSIDLVFGGCWHLGQEAAYSVLSTSQATVEDLTELATRAFIALWERDAAPYYGMDETFPKSPSRARDMYYAYFQRYLSDDRELKILGIEQPFTVALPGLPSYIGRMDRVAMRDDELEIFECKTSKYATPVVFAGYEASLQTEGYLTAGHLYYDKVPKIIYDQALCQKSKIDFTRYTITKKRSAIERFLSDYSHHVGRLIADLDKLKFFYNYKNEPKTYPIECFTRSAGYACTMYFRPCEYMELCSMRNNPMLWLDNPPQGFEIEHWNPREHQARHAEILKEVIK